MFKKKEKENERHRITFARVGRNEMEAGHVSKCQLLLVIKLLLFMIVRHILNMVLKIAN